MAKYAKINMTSEEYRQIIGEKINRIRKFADAEPEIITETIIEGQKIELEEVRPGEIITSDLFNRIIKKLNALELQANAFDDLFKLGPLAEDIHTIIVLSGLSNDEEGLWVDGVHKVSNLESGMNLIILDRNLEVIIDKKNPDLAKIKEIISNVKEEELLILITMINLEKEKEKTAPREKVVDETAAKIIGGYPINYTINQIIIGRMKKNVPQSLLSAKSKVTPLSVWGIYSIPHDRFLIGGATGYDPVGQSSLLEK